ncbi:MAG TPA: TonB-dependent receptor, partial [Verrucomicrobiae bacterium]|nr:TonB-dependent receptor [Verrucomicrobiae bacterium]
GSTSGGLEGSVALHLDGAYISQPASLDFLMFDVASVEVLRGPQGTLYGRNATGGTINFTPNRPTREVEGGASFLYGAYGRARVEGVLSGPVNDRLSLRFAGLLEDQEEGYGENLFLGEDVGTRGAYGARLGARLDVTDNFRIDATAFNFRDETNGIQLTPLNPLNATALANNPIFSTAAPRPSDPRDSNSDAQADGERSLRGGNVTMDWDINPNVELRSITSYTRVDYSNFNAEGDSTEIEMVRSDRVENTASWQQEFDLTFSLFDDRLEGLVGVFYDEETLYLRGHTRWLASNPQGYVNVAGRIVPAGTDTIGFVDMDTTSTALFTDLTYHVSDRFSVYGGVRQSRDEREMLQTTGLAGLPGNVGLAACTAQTFAESWDSTTGKLGVAYESGVGNFYLQWADGFKAGGFNPYNCGDTYEPEEVTSIEAGYKVLAFGDRLRLQTSVFHYDYTNLQVSQIVNLQTKIENAAAATVTGAEIELAYQLTDNLSIDIGAALLDAAYDEYADLDPLRPGLGFIDLSGNRLNRAPEHTINLGVNYTTEFGGFGALTLRAEMFNSADVYFRQFNQPEDGQEAYTTYNAFATLDPAGPLSVRAFVRNITDEDLLLGVFSAGTIFDRWAVYAPPRTWGVEISADF